jgi:tetratricopeptide (TPR) repeat protein
MFGLKGGRREATRRVIAEAERRGVRVGELRAAMGEKAYAEFLETLVPPVDLGRWGLVPRAELAEAPLVEPPELAAACGAAAAGRWEPAAALMAGCWGDWDRRAAAATALGAAAADENAWLLAWRAAHPDDGHAVVVDAEALAALAWQLAAAEQPSAQQHRGVHRVLAEAEQTARRAADLLPEDPTPWMTLCRVGRATLDPDAYAEVWAGVTARAPLHRRAHLAALPYWAEKGSYERAYDFADQAARRSPSLLVLPLVATYEHWTSAAGPGQAVWRRPGAQLALDALLAWLAGAGAGSPDRRDDLGWAAMALVNADRGAEAVPLFQRLGAYAGGSPWRDYPSPAKTFNDYRTLACKAAGQPA